MRGTREHGQTVQLSRTHGVIPVGGKTVKVGPIVVLSGAAAAYAATDVFGSVFKITVPKSGIIQGYRFLEQDDDTLTAACHLFTANPTSVPADNAVFSLSDEDAKALEATLTITSNSRDYGNGILYYDDNLGIPYVAPSGVLWGVVQLLTGTPTIAAGVLEMLSIYILADE